MKFGQFEVFRWHQDVTDSDSINRVMEKIELGDEIGLDEIWIAEHHFSRHGLISGIFSLLGNVAARTKHARIGTAVVVLPFHHPIQVAEEAATIDILSGGRLSLGVGAGYQRQEFEGLGVDIEEGRQRFREYVEVIQKAWEPEPLTYKGDFIDVREVNVIPKPLQKGGIPIQVAVTTSPESIDFAASTGLQIMVGGPTAVMGQVPEIIEHWHERMEHYGHPHQDIDLAVGMSVYVAPTMEEAESDLAGLEDVINEEFRRLGNPKDSSGRVPESYRHWANREQERAGLAKGAQEVGIMPLIGTPEVLIERIEALQSLGINSIRGTFGAAGLDQGKTLNSMRMFADEVMPHFA
ncbi:MAG: LLM class flavin-dependent oxidoreductase [Chloroflexi bacterium]|nr:LLM class flavin-dependent oxidoreductase [Chloroflexota bacterium]MBT4074625.1 LLM class flavin-dependent oxidoreductase [Chloroflexota bacterium]MBT4514386.1 LLM class flavin-dependent oxidoreductase [Chloroflexota bacterium]MBT5318282.1 LLM class flavin-dependent oxidoreductase [Chloroflexota bacterium]MBT6681363.1 LLM class flavin-dependent oxidoreductase [Chloroflexota bacterium]